MVKELKSLSFKISVLAVILSLSIMYTPTAYADPDPSPGGETVKCTEHLSPEQSRQQIAEAISQPDWKPTSEGKQLLGGTTLDGLMPPSQEEGTAGLLKLATGDNAESPSLPNGHARIYYFCGPGVAAGATFITTSGAYQMLRQEHNILTGATRHRATGWEWCSYQNSPCYWGARVDPYYPWEVDWIEVTGSGGVGRHVWWCEW